MAKYSIEEYFDFIEKYTPTFKSVDGGIGMFTIPTQHISSSNVEELLNEGSEL